MSPNLKSWYEIFAPKDEVHASIIKFCEMKPQYFRASDHDETQTPSNSATLREWAQVNRILKGAHTPEIKKTLVCKILIDDISKEFLEFSTIS